MTSIATSLSRMRTCCVLHALPGAFAHDRHVCASHNAGPAPSFDDQTPHIASPKADGSNTATADLFERPAPGQRTVVRGGTVLTMRDRVALPDHDVLIRDGVIEGIRPSGDVPPEGALLIEAGGKFVMPGFSNVHAHPFVKSWADAWKSSFKPDLDPDAVVLPYDLLMFQYLAAGVTRIEVMAGCAEMLAVRRAIEAGRMQGPRMRIGSPIIDGSPPIHSPLMSWIINDADGGRRAAQEVIARGFDFAKPYSNLNREAYTGLAEECRALGVRMMGHVTHAVGIEDAIAMGQGGIAHVAEYFYNETGAKRRDRDMFAHYARLSVDNGVWVHATVTVTGIMEVLMGKRPLMAPDRDLMNPLMTKMFALDGAFAEMIRNNPEKAYLGDDTFALSATMTAALRDAGARILTGVDEPNPYLVEGFSLHEEFANLVEAAGLSPLEVLEATTAVAADYHNESATAGRVALGMVADLVVLDRDPRDDIHATRAIDTVLKGGAILRKEAIGVGIGRIKERFGAMPV